jgi:acetate kinase
MGTRSGDIDQSVVLFLIKQMKMTADEVNNLLQKESGLKGLTGYSDLREISEQASQGNEDCIHGLNLVAYRIKKYIGSYAAILNGLDAIVFTAGIGENSSIMRKLACEKLDFLGIALDQDKNMMHSNQLREIQSKESKVKILVIPTNEEIEIAKQTYQILQN